MATTMTTLSRPLPTRRSGPWTCPRPPCHQSGQGGNGRRSGRGAMKAALSSLSLSKCRLSSPPSPPRPRPRRRRRQANIVQATSSTTTCSFCRNRWTRMMRRPRSSPCTLPRPRERRQRARPVDGRVNGSSLKHSFGDKNVQTAIAVFWIICAYVAYYVE